MVTPGEGDVEEESGDGAGGQVGVELRSLIPHQWAWTPFYTQRWRSGWMWGVHVCAHDIIRLTF